jgi:mono/diheme cytochrome c family protein
MFKSIFGLPPAAVGLLSACLSIGCSEVAPSECESATCDNDNDDLKAADSGKKAADAGKRDASVKADAGKPKDVDASAPIAKLLHLPCDVKAVVDDKCGSCHGSDPSAPMSLVSAADFQAVASNKQKMYANVKDKITSSDPKSVMPPAGFPELSESELETMTAWLDKGAPGSSVASCSEAPEPTPTPTRDAGVPVDEVPDDTSYREPTDEELECHRLLAHNGDNKTPMKVGVADDAYFAFVFAAPWKETAYGTVIRPIVDNKKALHHWLLFQDLAPGVPGGAVPQIGAHPTGQLIAAWAPGADPMDFRSYKKEVALELPADTTYTVEFHYNSSDANAVDASGVEVCTSKRKPKNIAAYSWLGNDNLGFPSTHWTGTCKPGSQEPIHIVSFMPHMHLKGIHMKGTITRKDGTKEVVHDKPFNFEFQRSYSVDLTLNPGDSITTDCDYSAPSVFGQPTDQEMCYLFAMAYPKGALASPDIWGGIAHGASSCLGM